MLLTRFDVIQVSTNKPSGAEGQQRQQRVGRSSTGGTGTGEELRESQARQAQLGDTRRRASRVSDPPLHPARLRGREASKGSMRAQGGRGQQVGEGTHKVNGLSEPIDYRQSSVVPQRGALWRSPRSLAVTTAPGDLDGVQTTLYLVSRVSVASAYTGAPKLWRQINAMQAANFQRRLVISPDEKKFQNEGSRRPG